MPLVDKDRPTKTLMEIVRECLIQSREKRLSEPELLNAIRSRYPSVLLCLSTN